MTTDRTHMTQDLVDGLARLLGSDFSAAELSAIAAALPEVTHLELVDSADQSPPAPSAALGKAVLDALVETGIFTAKFGSPVIKDEYDATSTESVEELYAMTTASRRQQLH